MSVRYDYHCRECDQVFEECHPMMENPTVICPHCKSVSTHKVPQLVGVVTKSCHSIGMGQALDQVKRNVEMKDVLRQDLGIEKIHPLRRSTMTDIYNDAMIQKTYIKESMAAQAEKRAAELKIKQTEWKKAALLRSPRRAKERMERKASADAAKRAIRL